MRDQDCLVCMFLEKNALMDTEGLKVDSQIYQIVQLARLSLKKHLKEKHGKTLLGKLKISEAGV